MAVDELHYYADLFGRYVIYNPIASFSVDAFQPRRTSHPAVPKSLFGDW